MRDSGSLEIVVLSRQDERVATLNSILRAGGHASHCTKLDKPNALDDTLDATPADLLILFADEPGFEPESIAAMLARRQNAPPLLLAREDIDEDVIAGAMAYGARDVVSLTNRQRLVAVIEREQQAHRMRLALDGLMSSANTYKRELRDLMDGTSDAIVDVQEGIIVAANPAWLALLAYEDESAMEGQPFMDLFRESDRQGLKGALVACLKGKWAGGTLNVAVHQADGNEIALDVRLEKVSIDGEPAVRVLVPIEAPGDQTPTELLERAISRDPSTGFYNRQYFLEQLDERLQAPLDAGVRAMVYVRPDNFAKVQDNVGVLGSEALLVRLGEVVREFMQPHDLYGRFGGTVFVALLQRGAMSDAEAWAEKLRKAIHEQIFEVEQQSTSLTCTLGMVEVTAELCSPADLMAEAERACRQGREAGGNRVQYTPAETETTSIRETDALWVPRLRNALMNNRLRLVNQPVNSLNEDGDGMFDTRVRLLDEQDQLILPGEFMPAAERHGLVKNVDRWVIGASLSFCAAKSPKVVFVRLSRESIVDDSLLDWLKSRVQKARVKPGQLCFQCTEEVVAQQLRQAKEVSEQLRAEGFLFAVDHLGVGRDSPQIIKHVPMDYAKIDGSLMQGLHRDQDAQKLVEALVGLAREHKIRTIAERVEDANTMAVLWQLGVAHIQGNYAQEHDVVLEDTQSGPGLTANAVG